PGRQKNGLLGPLPAEDAPGGQGSQNALLGGRVPRALRPGGQRRGAGPHRRSQGRGQDGPHGGRLRAGGDRPRRVRRRARPPGGRQGHRQGGPRRRRLRPETDPAEGQETVGGIQPARGGGWSGASASSSNRARTFAASKYSAASRASRQWWS